MPSQDPVATLAALVEALRTDEIAFLEGGSELYEIEGRTFTRPAPKGAAWAASLAIAMRPQLFGLGGAPLALAGLAPRRVFRPEPEDPVPAILRETVTAASEHLRADLDAIRSGMARADERLSGLYASSRAPDAWHLLLGLGPLTRAELARALGVTKRTASQAALRGIEVAAQTGNRCSQRFAQNRRDRILGFEAESPSRRQPGQRQWGGAEPEQLRAHGHG